MRIIRHPKKKSLKGSVVALGTFDGVHRGHQVILQQAVKQAKKDKTASIAITFDPHPQLLISPERGLKLLTTLTEREKLFCRYGIDGVVVIRFNKRLQALAKEDFVKKYLVEKIGASHVFVGFDYAFGKSRAGDVSQLKKLGKKHGFAVTVVRAVSADKHVIKSKVIRELLSQGKFNQAVQLLGHAYQIEGVVVRGSGRGKPLGFPTANLRVANNKLIPAHGVYAGLWGEKKCAVNIGARPTFGAGETAIEVHIPRHKKNLRGQRLNLILTRRLREERQFSDVEKLKRQIAKDIRRL